MILENLFEGHKNVAEHFLKISEDFRRLPKIFEEDPRMFRSYTNEFENNLRDKLDSCEIIDILTNEDMENTPTRVPHVVWYDRISPVVYFPEKHSCLYNK